MPKRCGSITAYKNDLPEFVLTEHELPQVLHSSGQSILQCMGTIDLCIIGHDKNHFQMAAVAGLSTLKAANIGLR